jgi:hypothetical protein
MSLISCKASYHVCIVISNTPPQVDDTLLHAPPLLHFSQYNEGGCQMTSTMEGVLRGWIKILHFLRMLKSVIELLKIRFVLFSYNETLEQMREITFFQWICLFI